MTIFCRLCAESKDSTEIITSINDSERLIREKLIACCQWDIRLNETNLPEEVCECCLDKLDKSWLFSQSVQLAQRKLLEIFDTTDAEPSKQTTQLPLIGPSDGIQTNYDCNECSNTFSSRIDLEKHDCNTPTKIHKCNICHKTFKTNAILRTHCNRQIDLKCEICSMVFCKEKALKIHKAEGCEGIIETGHILQNTPTFVDCSPILNIKIEEGLEMPLLSDTFTGETVAHYDETNVYKDIEKEAAGTSSSKRKVRSSDSNNCKRKYLSKKYQRTDGQNYCCHLCNKWFEKFPTLKGHMRLHTYPLKHKCQYCNMRFRIERHLISHLKTHTDYIDFSCGVCNKKCKSAFTLKVHKRAHFGASVKMYGCEECDHFFIEVSTYYNHMRRKHGIDTAEAKRIVKVVAPNGSAKPYVCEHCGKDFFDRCALKSHSLVHLDIRPFKCDICPKSFKNKYNLKSHQETHTGEKSVHCTVCGKKYSRKEVLIKHMEEHTGIFKKTYTCDFCDKVCRSSYNMRIHRRTHTGERPYRCEVCKFSATTKTQLDKHLKTISHKAKSNETLTQYPNVEQL